MKGENKETYATVEEVGTVENSFRDAQAEISSFL